MKNLWIFLLLGAVIAEKIDEDKETRRIYGSTLAAEHKFDYQAAIAIEAWAGVTVVCSGAIIDKFFVLTAGHCLDRGQMWVKVGSNDVVDMKKGSWHRVVSYSTKFQNESSSYSHDLTVLYVRPEMPVGKAGVRPIHIADHHFTELEPQTKVTISGWGMETAYTAPKFLRNLTVTTISSDECFKRYWNKLSHLEGAQICARPKPSQGPCGGDDGAPLVYEDSEGFQTLVGILSYGFQSCDLGIPQVYTYVKFYHPWIKKKKGLLQELYAKYVDPGKKPNFKFVTLSRHKTLPSCVNPNSVG